MHFPLEYHAEVVKPSERRGVAAGRAPRAGVAAAIGIFLLLQAALGSWRLAALRLPDAAGRARRRPAWSSLIGGGDSRSARCSAC